MPLIRSKPPLEPETQTASSHYKGLLPDHEDIDPSLEPGASQGLANGAFPKLGALARGPSAEIENPFM